MRRLRKIVSEAVLAFLLLIVVAVAYSTMSGYTTWWVPVATGHVAVNGVRSGYLHRTSRYSALIITRTDVSPAQSYLVGLSERPEVIHCGRWHAPRFFPFPIGDVSPPCSVFSGDWNLPEADNPTFATLRIPEESVEFYTMRGKKVFRQQQRGEKWAAVPQKRRAAQL
jgi:hypothetical protein